VDEVTDLADAGVEDPQVVVELGQRALGLPGVAQLGGRLLAGVLDVREQRAAQLDLRPAQPGQCLHVLLRVEGRPQAT